ncbi:MAG: class I SAM-dependent methyltransferase [Bryobacteraceae bacterium]
MPTPNRHLTIAEGFDRAAANYDQARRKLVPCFDHFYGWVVRLLPFAIDAPIDVLDLGAGTGLLSAWVLEGFPNARLHLVDLSEPMLARARERFANRATAPPTPPTMNVLDYAHSPLDGPYDAIVSALSIHHLTDDLKRDLYARIFAALRPGGVFINADQVLGTTVELEKAYQQTWYNDARALGATDEELNAALIRMQEDRSATLDAQLEWLNDLGFETVDCWFKEARFAVFCGRKPKE